eukprot:scaffold12397_cov124-Isochrysis_galbana.AAC.4
MPLFASSLDARCDEILPFYSHLAFVVRRALKREGSDRVDSRACCAWLRAADTPTSRGWAGWRGSRGGGGGTPAAAQEACGLLPPPDGHKPEVPPLLPPRKRTKYKVAPQVTRATRSGSGSGHTERTN